MTRDDVLKMLEAHPDEYVSGAELAEALGISRTAVWKAVEQLRQDGYEIDSQPRRGHRLGSGSDVLSEAGIRRYLTDPRISLRFYPTISSTNTVLKGLAAEDAPAGLTLVAGEQTAGRGRLGRHFFSPSSTGLYMSLLLRPEMEARDAVRLTACAAVAVAEAIESLSDEAPLIKWVNDIYIRDRKVCGILTEAGLNCETGRMDYVIVGIGINTRIPDGDFPEEIRGVAGSVFAGRSAPDARNRLAAGVLNRLIAYSDDPGAKDILKKYRERSFVVGKEIRILAPGKEPVSALALGIEEDYSLRVRMPDQREELISSGEISIRTKGGFPIAP